MIKRFLTSMINVTRSMIIVTHSLENQVTQSMIDIKQKPNIFPTWRKKPKNN